MAQVTESAWALSIAVAAISVGGLLYIAGVGRKRRRPTQHDLDPTLKKNQVRITTQKKAFRRDELPPEYLATLARRDIVEIPMGAPRPSVPVESPAPARNDTADWLPENLQQEKKSRKQAKKGR